MSDLRARVEALGLARPDPIYNEAITDVLALLTETEEEVSRGHS